jgi:hypothetical protein
MALTIIDPVSSWFGIMELPVVEQLCQQTVSQQQGAINS